MAYIAKITAGGNENMLIGSTLYGECTTAANDAAKIVHIPGFDTLIKGVTIHVKFTNTNSVANPTLDVSSTGSKNIRRYGTTSVSTNSTTSWNAGSVVSFTYDGTDWQMNDFNNTTYSSMSAAEATTGTGTTARTISAKVLNDLIDAKITAALNDLELDGFIKI